MIDTIDPDNQLAINNLNNKYPEFPNSKKLEFQDKELIEKLLLNFPPYSDFNFLSLWSYNTKDDIEFSIHNNNIICKMRDYITGEFFYTFAGSNSPFSTIETIFKYLQEHKLPLLLKIVPETSIDQIQVKQRFNIIEDRDQFDYIYSIEGFANLKGGDNVKIRNYCNRFKELYSTINQKTLDLSNLNDQVIFLSIFDRWRQFKNQDKEAITERLALERLFQISSQVDNLYNIVLYDVDKPIGFFIGEQCKSEYAISHFAKADSQNYHGIYAYLYHKSSMDLFNLGYKYVNYEQDLGIPGLRRSKEQMHPVYFLKKYSISPS